MPLTNSEPYEILTGVGDLYLATLGTAFPTVDATPGASWRHLGFTQDGVSVKRKQKIEKINVDQETGGVKANRTEESLTIETSLAELTAENLADALGNSVTTTAAGTGTIGKKEVGLYSGGYVKNFTLLFRGKSAYGEMPAQYQIPVCYIDGDLELKSEKGKNQVIKAAFEALVDPDATSDDEKFGKLVMQHQAAL
jgi:hypothetical protein